MDWIEKMNVVGTAVDNAPETVQKNACGSHAPDENSNDYPAEYGEMTDEDLQELLFSKRNYRKDGCETNIPLYLAGRTKELL